MHTRPKYQYQIAIPKFSSTSWRLLNVENICGKTRVVFSVSQRIFSSLRVECAYINCGAKISINSESVTEISAEEFRRVIIRLIVLSICAIVVVTAVIEIDTG